MNIADDFTFCTPNGSAGLAIDPATGHIYACFEALQTSFPQFYANPDPGNSDVFIARSTDDGATFQPWVRLPGPTGYPWSDEFIPAMVLDGYGGLSLLYYSSITQDPDAPNAEVHACYARVKSLPTTPVVPSKPELLTPQPFLTNRDELPSGDKELGDYQQIAASGGYAFAAYVSTQDPDGAGPLVEARRLYVQRITICPPDLNKDMALTAEDVALAADGGAGDFNQDGLTDTRDFVDYLDAYTAGCE